MNRHFPREDLGMADQAYGETRRHGTCRRAQEGGAARPPVWLREAARWQTQTLLVEMQSGTATWGNSLTAD